MKTCFQIIRKLINTRRMQLILCKDNANERNENLFSDCRMQLILCKVRCFIGQKRKKLMINFSISDKITNFVCDFENRK